MYRKLIRLSSLISAALVMQACVISISSSIVSSSSTPLSFSESSLSEVASSLSSSSLISSASSSSLDEDCWNVVTGSWVSCSSSVSISSSSSVAPISSSSSELPVSSSSAITSVSSTSSILVSSESSQPISSSYSSSSSPVYEGYYYGADDLSGTALKLFLREIITEGFIGVTYGDARYIMQKYDADPAATNKVLLIYNRASVNATWDGGSTWNREHVWPQSRLGASASNGTANIASDLHNLRAANPSINTSRGNKNFDLTTTASSYYPGEADKGDVARILMYMAIRYPQLNLVNGLPSDSTTSIGNLQTLLLWHEQDPPDMFEKGRNEIIYSGAIAPEINKFLKQNNRNPFVDHPEFARLIWNANGTLIP